MSSYDEIREQYENASLEEKMILIRYGNIQYLTRITGYAKLLKSIALRNIEELPDDYSKWCEQIIEAANNFADEIDGVFDTNENNRETRRVKQEARDNEFALRLWQHNQKNLAELKNYDSLKAALFDRLDQISITQLTPLEHSFPPHHLSTVEFGRPWDRRIRIGIHYQPGYIIHLSRTTDKRNLKSESFEGITSSIDEACVILKEWILNSVSFDTILQNYSWFKEVPYP